MEKSATGRQSLGSERGWERGARESRRGLEAHRSAGGLPVLPAPSPARGTRVCLQHGRASLPAAAAPAVLAGGAYAAAVAAARSSASTLHVPPVNPNLCAVVATFSVCA